MLHGKSGNLFSSRERTQPLKILWRIVVNRSRIAESNCPTSSSILVRRAVLWAPAWRRAPAPVTISRIGLIGETKHVIAGIKHSLKIRRIQACAPPAVIALIYCRANLVFSFAASARGPPQCSYARHGAYFVLFSTRAVSSANFTASGVSKKLVPRHGTMHATPEARTHNLITNLTISESRPRQPLCHSYRTLLRRHSRLRVGLPDAKRNGAMQTH